MDDFKVLSDDQKLALQKSESPVDVEKIVSIFNSNLKKKELLRISKLSELQDAITSQVSKRLEKHADEFSNRDLIDYFKIFQETISKTDTSVDSIPQISITQNQLNINVSNPEFDQDSRQRILKAVKQLMTIDNNQTVIDDEGVVTIDDTESQS